MLYKLILRFSMFYFLSLSSSFYAFSEHLEIKVGMTQDFKPYNYLDGGEFKGLDIDIINLIFSKTKYHLDFQEFPNARLGPVADSGLIDIVLSTYCEDEYFENVTNTEEPIYSVKILGFENTKFPQYVESLQDMQGKYVGVVRGGLIVDEIESFTAIKTLQILKTEPLVKLLAAGRIDVAIAEEYPFIFYANEMGISIRPVFEFSSLNVCIGLSLTSLGKEFKSLKRFVEMKIRYLKASGDIERVLNRRRQ